MGESPKFPVVLRVWDELKYPVSTALFLTLSFPPYDLWICAWWALVPMMLGVQRAGRPRRAFLYGFLAGFAFFAALLGWLSSAICKFGGLPGWAGAAVWLLTSAALGLFVGAFALALFFVVRRYGWRGFLSAPFLWTTAEFARNHLALTGFPWGSLGTSQVFFGHVVQVADTTGVYGVSFLVCAGNVTAFVLLRPEIERRARLAVAAFFAALMAYVFIYAEARYLTLQTVSDRPFSVGVVQGNLLEENEWIEGHWTVYPQLLDELSKQRPGLDLVVFPENPAPLSLSGSPSYRKLLEKMAGGQGATLFVNGIRTNPDGSYCNSVFAIGPGGSQRSAYDKMRLVPFAEHVPFSSLFFFARSMSREISSFKPGERVVLLEAAGVPVGAFVCYEAIFPELARQFVDKGAQILVNVTNDAWFGRGAAPLQHVQHSLMRAVETRRWLVRAANSGVTAIVDPLGRVRRTIPSFQRGVAWMEVYPLDYRTPYVRLGDWFAWACASLSAFWILRSLRRSGRETALQGRGAERGQASFPP